MGQRPKRYKYDGNIKSLRDWAADKRAKVCYNTLCARVSKGWPLADALTTPPVDAQHYNADWTYPPKPPEGGWPIKFLAILVRLYEDETLRIKKACEEMEFEWRGFVHYCHSYDPQLYREFATRDGVSSYSARKKQKQEPTAITNGRRPLHHIVRGYTPDTDSFGANHLDKLERATDTLLNGYESPWSCFTGEEDCNGA